jgi:hypothetical protein
MPRAADRHQSNPEITSNFEAPAHKPAFNIPRGVSTTTTLKDRKTPWLPAVMIGGRRAQLALNGITAPVELVQWARPRRNATARRIGSRAKSLGDHDVERLAQ